jgi:4,5-DOPA dioxygenase extradiol
MDFDSWAEGALARLHVDALVDLKARAPAVEMALPTWEHYAPVLVALGVLGDDRPAVSFPVTGFWMGSAFTKRSLQLG